MEIIVPLLHLLQDFFCVDGELLPSVTQILKGIIEDPQTLNPIVAAVICRRKVGSVTRWAFRSRRSLVPSILDSSVPLSEVGDAALCSKVCQGVCLCRRRRFQRQNGTPKALLQNRRTGCWRQDDASLLVLIVFPACSLSRIVPPVVTPVV